MAGAMPCKLRTFTAVNFYINTYYGSKLDMDLAKRFGRTIGAHYPGRAHKALIYPGTLSLAPTG